jgi:hypothetical protein
MLQEANLTFLSYESKPTYFRPLIFLGLIR